MTTTTITLTVATVEERKVPPQNNNLGNMLVFDERITQINNNTALTEAGTRPRLESSMPLEAGRPALPSTSKRSAPGVVRARRDENLTHSCHASASIAEDDLF